MAERILIVDDDPVQRRLLEAMVRRFGYEATMAEGGERRSRCSAAPRRRRASTASCSIW